LRRGGIIAADAVTGVPVGTIVEAGHEIYRQNMGNAEVAVERTLAAHGQKLIRLEERVRAGEITGDEVAARLTVLQRCVHEAGRHPDKLLQDALGTFGARLFVEDIDGVERFELAEVLPRLTSLDVAFMDVVWFFAREGVDRRINQKGEEVLTRRTHCSVPVIWSELQRRGWVLSPRRMEDLSDRLEMMGLVDAVETSVPSASSLPTTFRQYGGGSLRRTAGPRPEGAKEAEKIAEAVRRMRHSVRTENRRLTAFALRLLELAVQPQVIEKPADVDVKAWRDAQRKQAERPASGQSQT
jgi:hypothetical protein